MKRTRENRYFLPLLFWESALAAADLEVALVRPSWSTLEAAVAALLDVLLAGALVCERALPAAFFEFAPVD
ncbi:hypothetical protein [Longimicrobium sp.]|uniref:hypothetical protein n=1 Tax=Longimicrobium sp. TaxID=2029185 RepID=UPI002E36D26C|nr:hypothetical protein [Longimicrobium sp.]HEX6037898.1 hypothetical protein [Longimicrobium sp.]